MKKKKEAKKKMHQHQDERGIVFGKKHPVTAKHKKESTQKFHDLTKGK